MTSINIHLFGKPEWEFGEKISPNIIKSKGEELKERLFEVADAVQKLSTENWELEMTLYDLILYKDLPKAEAKRELDRLGIKGEIYHLEEEEYEEEEEDIEEASSVAGGNITGYSGGGKREDEGLIREEE